MYLPAPAPAVAPVELEHLQATARRWGLEGELGQVRVALPDPSSRRVRVLDARALLVSLEAALTALHAPPPSLAWRRAPDSLTAWRLAAQLAARLVCAQQLVPDLVRADGVIHAAWRTVLDDASSATAGTLAAAMPPAAFAIARHDRAVWSPDDLLAAFFDAVGDLVVRQAAAPPRPGRPRGRLLPWTARWAEALGDREDPQVPLGEEAEELLAGIQGWLSTAGLDPQAALTEFRLYAPDDADGPWRLAFGVHTDEEGFVRAERVWHPEQPDAQAALLSEALMSGLARCARVFRPLDRALQQPTPTDVALDLDEAWVFVTEAAPLLAGAGVQVLLPADLLERNVHARVHVRVEGGAQATLEWEAGLGEQELSSAELEELLTVLERGVRPLVRWRGGWLRADPERVRQLHKMVGRTRELPLAEALALGLAESWPGGDLGEGVLADELVEVRAGPGLVALLDGVRGAPPGMEVDPPGFAGDLRPYQQRGVAWLGHLRELGLGGVLADEMGLGKTIELIAHLLCVGPPGPFLVVCPTSVIGNWQRELARFAPALDVVRFHGPQRPTELDPGHAVVLTTYGTLRRDVDTLASIRWAVVTLDEAQFVKNPSTAGARAVRRLHAAQVVALTGTPLENRLAELWSLLDATNPGLLGSRARFARRFVTPIEQRRDGVVAARLRRLIAPFVLRRTKDDPAVIAELPDKIERTVLCALTSEQARLYEDAVARVLADPALHESRMGRRGRILALLTELKKICNHPAQARNEGSDAPLVGRSGKLAVMRDIVAEAVEAGEQVLVFTQYVTMGELLVQQLSADLDTPVPFLHGGLTASRREQLVATFQGEQGPPAPVLIVSLRAGGTGLNLTAASHVVHYDRWWNPAVEDQATDRAHRIGQTKTVEVHKLVTAGTLEERIDALLAHKRSVAAQIVRPGEAWITELGDAELAELVALSPDAEVAELEEEVVGSGAWG